MGVGACCNGLHLDILCYFVSLEPCQAHRVIGNYRRDDMATFDDAFNAVTQWENEVGKALMQGLADDYEVPIEIVKQLADQLGDIIEDFDALVLEVHRASVARFAMGL